MHSPKDKAEILNNKFYLVFTKEDLTNIPECTGRPYPIMLPISISTAGIQKLLEEVDTKKASGPDNILAWVLKHCAREIAPILSKLFSQSLDTSNIPHDWLTANVTPVFKKGDRSNAANYRPISLASICCKLMEHILCHFIMNHLELHHILNNFQYGF